MMTTTRPGLAGMGTALVGKDRCKTEHRFFGASSAVRDIPNEERFGVCRRET